MVASIAKEDAVELQPAGVEGEALEAARDAVAEVDGVACGGDEFYLVEDDVAERAEMESADTHFAAPFFGEVVPGSSSYVGLEHRRVEQSQEGVAPQQEPHQKSPKNKNK